MSIHRWDAKTDTTEKVLVHALRDVGIQVWQIRRPCDLLLRFWCNRHQCFCWQTLEAKTPRGKKEPKPSFDRRQVHQKSFLEETQTPVAIDFESAWRELNKRHALGSTQVPCVLKTIPA